LNSNLDQWTEELSRLVNILIEFNETTNSNKLCIGSRPEEIEAYEAKLGIKLPLFYRNFLLIMGHDQEMIEGDYRFILSEERYDLAFSANDDGHCILPNPKENIYFYFYDSNNIFEAFYLESGDDPEVFRYYWCDGYVKLHKRFSDYIMDRVKEAVGLIQY
jgi:hypothetical protein